MHILINVIQMRNVNQLFIAIVLILGRPDDLSLTTHSLTLNLPALSFRLRLGTVHTIKHRAAKTSRITLAAITDDQKQKPDEWLSRASKIREEVLKLEAVAALSRQGRKVGTTEFLPADTVEYADIANSAWALSYRFADDPDDEDNSNKPRRIMGGKVTLKFRQDGYTDIISQESFGPSSNSCTLNKAWGWDIELSKDNENDASMKDQEYILFSIDVECPSSKNMNGGVSATSTTKERYYFQARKDTDTRNGIISLADGTVTVKRDIVQKSARWGFFSPAGILAQFRYVGDFVAKPVRMTETD